MTLDSGNTENELNNIPKTIDPQKTISDFFNNPDEATRLGQYGQDLHKLLTHHKNPVTAQWKMPPDSYL